MAQWTASAPGKVILMGEHGAVYGRPAVVAAIGLRLSASLRELGSAAGVELELPDLGTTVETSWTEVLRYSEEARNRWLCYSESPSRESFRLLRGDDPAHLVKVALGEALVTSPGAPVAPPPAGIRLRIASALPVGSGFGSSAAVAAAVLAVVDAWQQRPLAPGALKARALEIERRQHGLPSGVDTATVLTGGILWVERRGEELVTTPLDAAQKSLHRFLLFDSGPPSEPTGSVVAEVRSLKEQAPHRVEALLDRMAESTLLFRRSLTSDDGEEGLLGSMRTFQRCLEDLGVVPQEVQRRVRQVEAAGGGAKISGAGSLTGPGAGSLLVYHPDPEAISRWPFLSELRRYEVPFGDPGVRIETSDPNP